MSTIVRGFLIIVILFAVRPANADSLASIRLTAPERAVQMRVRVLYSGGTTLYDSDWRSGNIADLTDLPYGSYQLRISSRDLDGKLTEKQTTLQVSPDRISIDPALPEDLKLTTTAHDGTTGQIITTSGDLSFRFGDFLNRKDTEAMRLTPEGNLDVKGWIRAGQGILFSDGTIVDSKSAAEKKLKPKNDSTGTGTMNQISKWIDNAGMLGDSAVSEVGGNVGIGTATPSGKLHIFGAATADVFAGMGVDVVAGPAFNFGYGGASFGRSAGFFNVRPDGSAIAPNPSLRFLTGNAERMIITNLGNVGIGTSTPGGRFQIYAPPTADIFAGIGTDMSAGPSMNFGYGGATFGRGAGFFNARPDAGANPPNPSLRFMTNNVERMIIANSGNVGIGTSSPNEKLEVAGNVIVSGGLGLGATNSAGTSGVITLGGVPFAHNFGALNTFLGADAGNYTTTGDGNNTAVGAVALQANTTGWANTAIGSYALVSNTSGSSNTAVGMSALLANTTGFQNTAAGYNALTSNSAGGMNTAYGYYALAYNTTGSSNTAAGWGALDFNTVGINNTAVGLQALQTNTTGRNNIALGYGAGFNLTTGDFNIDIGNSGVAAEGNTIRIGDPPSQSRTFIAGISGRTPAGAAVAVFIDANGQLGTISSSRRYKFDIVDMAHATDKLMQLRPVTFRYVEHGEHAPLQYGLIAEEVANVYPELVSRAKDGRPETVMYQFLAPMLLNEVQKQRQTITDQQKTIDVLTSALSAVNDRLATIEKQFTSNLH